MSQAEKRGVGDLIELGSDCLIDGGIAMSMEVGPDRRVAVEIALPVGTDEPSAFARGDGEWFERGIHPLRMRRKGMPEMLPIETDTLSRIHEEDGIGKEERAEVRVWISFGVWREDRLRRRRAVPSGTVGYRMAGTSIPRLRREVEAVRAAEFAWQATRWIGPERGEG